jgi:hypothetical protein
MTAEKACEISEPTTEIGKRLKGAYINANLKPTLECIIIIKKPIPIIHRSDLWEACKIPYYRSFEITIEIPRNEDTEKYFKEKEKRFGISIRENDIIYKDLAIDPTLQDKTVLIRDEKETIISTEPYENSDITSDHAWAMISGKSVLWLDEGRFPIPVGDPNELDIQTVNGQECNVYGWSKTKRKNLPWTSHPNGRMPANLIVSDSILGGDFSRYFDLDAWWLRFCTQLPKEIRDTFPFLITTKPSRGEKEKGLKSSPKKRKAFLGGATRPISQMKLLDDKTDKNRKNQASQPIANDHETVKSITLFTWLITIGSREGDIVLDPFAGTFTSGIAAKLIRRKWIMIEKDPHYYELGKKRLAAYFASQSIMDWVKPDESS